MDDKIREMLKKYKTKQQLDFEKLSSDEKVKFLLEDRAKLKRRIQELEDALEDTLEQVGTSIKSTNAIECHHIPDEVHAALIITRNDDFIEVRCDGNCFDCPYGEG